MPALVLPDAAVREHAVPARALPVQQDAAPEDAARADTTVEPGRYPGSARAAADGSAPAAAFTVKAKAGTMRYYSPGSPYYQRTRAEVWFRSAEDAEAAGFVRGGRKV